MHKGEIDVKTCSLLHSPLLINFIPPPASISLSGKGRDKLIFLICFYLPLSCCCLSTEAMGGWWATAAWAELVGDDDEGAQ